MQFQEEFRKYHALCNFMATGPHRIAVIRCRLQQWPSLDRMNSFLSTLVLLVDGQYPRHSRESLNHILDHRTCRLAILVTQRRPNARFGMEVDLGSEQLDAIVGALQASISSAYFSNTPVQSHSP
jgi:hypothetical protein